MELAVLAFLFLFGASGRTRAAASSTPLTPRPDPRNLNVDPLANLSNVGPVRDTIDVHDGGAVLTSAEPARPPASEDDAHDAAHGLALYLSTNGRNTDTIKGFQRRMGHIRVDGIVGPETRARARLLGATL